MLSNKSRSCGTIAVIVRNSLQKMKSQEELDEKLVGLVHSLEEFSQAISRANRDNDTEELAKLLKKRTELEAECKKIERKRYELT
ncbi:TPA: hypothetical protein ACPVYA_002248 [Vibrio parahaemolyticus]